MFAFLITLHVIACVVLIMVILLQAGKGGGISETFGGGGGLQQMLGTKASSFLTKATAGCAILFLATSMTLALVNTQRTGSVVERELSKEEKISPPAASGKTTQTPAAPTASAATTQPTPNK